MRVRSISRAGVANPVFESHNEWWDLLCDVDSGTIKLPTPKQVHPPFRFFVSFPSSPARTRQQGSRSGEVSPELLAELQVDCESRLIAQAHNRFGASHSTRDACPAIFGDA